MKFTVPTPTPTNVQAALLEHLVRTGRPWSRGLLLDSGRPPRSTTVDALFRNRWLLPVTVRAKAHGRVVTEPIGVLTPVGRRALQKIDPSLATGWSDEDRVRMREDAPLRCLGPYETEECERHQGELEVYRWSWRTPRIADPARHLIEIDAGEPEMVLACPRCRAELWAAVRNPDTLARLREYTPEGK